MSSVQASTSAFDNPSSLPQTPPQRMTYPEFLDWLDEDKHAEWVYGEVIMHSPVSFRHNKVGAFLIKVLGTFIEERDLGALSYDPFQMKTGPGLPSRAPDIIFIAKENQHRLKPNLLEGPADLVIEIVSPESRGRDRGDKFYEYEEGGVREYWIIDPERQQAEFYLLSPSSRYVSASTDIAGLYHSTVLPGLSLDVGWLWQETPPTLREVMRGWE